MDIKPHQSLIYKPLRFKGVWLFVGYVLVILTAIVCLIPNPPDSAVIKFGDKFVHMTGYLGLFLWFAQIFRRENHYRPVIALVLWGVAIEFAQSLTSYRSFEIADMLANTSGVLVGWLMSGSYIGYILINLETFFLKKLAA